MNVTPKDPRLNPKMAARVAMARGEWESRPVNGNSRIFASFDDMLDAFASDCMRFTDIGVGLGVSRERVRQIWRDYFASLFRVGRTGRQRWRACTIATRTQAAREAVPQGLAAVAADAARLRGMSVAAVLARSKGSQVFPHHHRLRINEKLCAVAQSSWPRKTNPASLVGGYRFRRITADSDEFKLLYCGSPLDCWFIMPIDIFRTWNGVSGQMVYIPERPNTYALNAHLKQTDWMWQYRDAWHLLK